DLLPADDGIFHGLEHLEFGDLLKPDGAKGERLIQIAPTEGELVVQVRGQLMECAAQRSFEAGSVVSLQGTTRHAERDQFTLGDVQGGAVRNLLRVMIAIPQRIKPNRKAHLIAHVVQIPLYGADARFETCRKAAPRGEFVCT